MQGRMRAARWAVVICVGVLAGCGIYGGNKSKPAPVNPGTGAVVTFMTDQSLCDLLGLHILVTKYALTTSSGGSVTVFPNTSGTQSPKLPLTSLRDFTTLMNFFTVPAESYTQASITLAITQATVYDPTQSPPTRFLTTTLTSTTATADINPPLVVTKGQVAALKLDFDIPRSVEVDAQGDITGNITPTMTAAALTASGSQGFGELDDLVGFVRSVSTSSTGTSSSGATFIGGFLMQLLSGTGPALEANLTNANQLIGPQDLGHLPTDSVVELDGYVDSKGNLVANSAFVEGQTTPETNDLAYIGPIMSVTRDASGNVTQYTQIASEIEPNSEFNIVDDAVLTVNVSSTTTYGISLPSNNFASPPLTFGPANFQAGQEVVTFGVYVKSTGTTGQAASVTISADSIYLKLESLEGNFTTLLQAASDDHSGGFQFAGCGTVVAPIPIIVITNSNTVFLNVAGLSELTPQPSLLVKGLAFYEPQATTINGVSIPAGTLVILAKQVHQLTS